MQVLFGIAGDVLQVALEDLVFGVFDVAEVVFLDGPDEGAGCGGGHNEAGADGESGQFHGDASGRMGRQAARCARSPIVAARKILVSATWHADQTPCAGHQLCLPQIPAPSRQTFNCTGPSMASTTVSIETNRCTSGSSMP